MPTFCQDIKKQKVALSFLRHKIVLNKHLNAFFYEHSNVEERDE